MRYSIIFLLLLFAPFAHAQGWKQVHDAWGVPKSDYTRFGEVVAIDGDFAAIGAPYESDTSFFPHLMGFGAVYIYQKTAPSTWVFKQRLLANVPSFSDKFGWSIAIEGGTMVITAPEEDDDENELNPINAAGSAFIFLKDQSGVWKFHQKLVPQNRQNFKEFGAQTDLNNQRIVITSRGLDPMAFIFEKQPNGYWAEVQSIQSTDFVIGDHFGEGVAMSDSIIAVGDYRNDLDSSGQNPIMDAGAVYLFMQNTSGTWFQFQKITVPNRDSTTIGAGLRLDITNDYLAFSGSDFHWTTQLPVSKKYTTGAIYIYRLNNSGKWRFDQQLKLLNHLPNHYYQFRSIDLSGNRMVTGVLGYSIPSMNGGPEISQAYVYTLRGGKWKEEQRLISSDHERYDLFGSDVGIAGNNIVVGAAYKNQYQGGDTTEVGKAYFFEKDFVDHSDTTEICEGDSLFFNNRYVNETGKYLDTLLDQNGGDSIVALHLNSIPLSHTSDTVALCEGDTYPVNGLLLDSVGVYQFKLKSVAGCDSIFTLKLFKPQRPEYRMPDDTIICFGEIFQLPENVDLKLIWAQEPGLSQKVFYDSDVYYYNTYKGSCMWADSVRVTVPDCEKLVFIPNAFSPNGDGLNDVFKPFIYRQLSSYQMHITDRWGKIIFSSQNLDNGWDGRNESGRSYSAGVYIYKIEYKTTDGISDSKFGHVTLIR